MKEPLPGEFYFDDSEEKEVLKPQREEHSLDERIKLLAEKKKSFITPERIHKLLPSQDLLRAFNTIRADTFSLHNLAVLEKQQNVLEIREKKIIDETVMKNFPLVYIGSGVDAEYPLLLGARKIIMLDPELKNPDILERLRQRISNLSKGNFREDKGSFHFKFNFGDQEEEVIIKVDPRLYVKKGNTSIKEENRFTPPEKVGMLLAFHSENPARDEESIGCVVQGGYIFANRSMSSKICKGFDSIQLESFEDGYPQSFLKKK